MSCIAGLVHLDGAPVDPALLARMIGTMKDRAPDEHAVWCAGPVGLAHARLRTSSASGAEHQPCTLDGEVWLAADARLDGRADLVATLRGRGERVRGDAPDGELILHAYRAFGESLLEHLIGDFAFALWDQRCRTLLCARDHFGVRPFYYTHTGQVLAFASDIAALLVHPAVSPGLDETAIGDFLVLGQYQDPALTVYQNVRRLPAACRLRVRDDDVQVREYWRLPPQEWRRSRRRRDHVEEFAEVFTRAVHDRLGADHVAMELSGGMDSASIAGVAAAHARTHGHALTALTVTANQLDAGDQEGHYAAMVASYLSIPSMQRELGEHRLFARYGDADLRTAEPSPVPHRAFSRDALAQLSGAGARVLLSGQGGDEVLGRSSAYLPYLLRRGRLGAVSVEILDHLRRTGSVRGMGLRAVLAQWLGRPAPSAQTPVWRPAFPDWLNPGFVARTRLRDRWEAAWARMVGASEPEQRLREWASSQVFASYEMFNLPMVARHPFFDVRLVTVVLGMPDTLKRDKRVVREAMHGKLPEAVRVRPKTPFAGDVVRAALTRNLISTPIDASLSLVGDGYLETDRYQQALGRYLAGEGSESTWSSVSVVAPVCLNFWLSQRASSFNPRIGHDDTQADS